MDRPPLGGLRLPTGEVVPLDRGVVLGRKPAPAEGSTDWPHLVHLPADHSFVSRDAPADRARRLGRGRPRPRQPRRHHASRPGPRPERMRPGDAYVLEPGTVLDMAHVYSVRYESGAVAR